ncbi:MAG: hypothetical protein N2327_08395 [Caldimicrobium sp.]|nr:hypothetical protein [Caldimicrobium sp.]MCX7874428.1 hypothetical protein [Caldimicrobium sp.]MDW8093987.1 hypothetical protein [Caldimicrobium sp.]
MLKKVDNAFERRAEEYDLWYENYQWVYLSEIEAIRLHLIEGLSLEVGVGTGRFSQALGIHCSFYSQANFYSPSEVLSLLKDFQFKLLNITQTLFQSLDRITKLEPVKLGYGEGGFVVVSAEKK